MLTGNTAGVFWRSRRAIFFNIKYSISFSFFLDYLARCLPSTTTPSKDSTSESNKNRFPYGPISCRNITSKTCRDYSNTQTLAWNVSCFVDGVQVRSCASVCYSTNRFKRLRCEDFCSGIKYSKYKTQIPTLLYLEHSCRPI